MGPPDLVEAEEVFVPPPVRARDRAAHERRKVAPPPPRKINYLEREARNGSLGKAGELFALEAEHRRLWKAGHRTLAERIDHVSESIGDGLGYDIRSFDEDGADRLIEVKTTNFGSMTPFFASAKEVAVSADAPDRYHVYRVFKFREAPRLFSLPGSLRSNCTLDPTGFRASLL